MNRFQMDVLEFLLDVPDGKVVTYGQIAIGIGKPGASRAVGNALHLNPDPNIYPCYKVVNSKGELAHNFAFGGIEEQKKRLEDDGVSVYDFKVDLTKFQWRM